MPVTFEPKKNCTLHIDMILLIIIGGNHESDFESQYWTLGIR